MSDLTGIIEIHPTREEAIEASISNRALEAVQSGEICRVKACLGGVCKGENHDTCTMCEVTICYPDGRIEKERAT